MLTFGNHFSLTTGANLKTYLKDLISLFHHMGTFTIKPFNEIVRFHKYAGYYQHDTDFLQNQIGKSQKITC